MKFQKKIIIKTPLYISFQKNNAEMVRLLLSQSDINVNIKTIPIIIINKIIIYFLITLLVKNIFMTLFIKI